MNMSLPTQTGCPPSPAPPRWWRKKKRYMSTEQQPAPSGNPEGKRKHSWGLTSLPEILARLRAELPLLAPRKSIGTKLILVLGVAMAITFGALGWMNMY